MNKEKLFPALNGGVKQFTDHGHSIQSMWENAPWGHG